MVQDPAGADTAARPRQAVPGGLWRLTVMTYETPGLPAVVAATATDESRPASESNEA